MRARALALSILSSAAVLAVGWQLGTHGQTPTAQDAGTSATQAATPTPVSVAGSAPVTGATAAPTSTGTSGTFTGSSVPTRYGSVQVQITVANGSITDVAALQLTDRDQRSVSISNRAAPVLRQKVLASQSATVHGVSGATYTSDAYLSSLQSALDQAGI